MPHVALVAMSGVRIVDDELLSLGLTLPGAQSRRQAIAELPASGLLTLAALTGPEWTQSYHAAVHVTDELLQDILRRKPRLASISALTASVPAAYSLSQRLRAAGVLTVLGGLHATACPEEAAVHFDAVCVGDGEPTWLQILADAARGRLQSRYQVADWTFPEQAIVPRWDLLQTGRLPRYILQTQRGCPLACSFCAASRLLGSYREKPVTALKDELAAIRRHAGNHRPLVEFADDNTFAGRRGDDFWELLSGANIRFFTESDWRIGERPDVLRQLANVGCRQVLVGMESLEFRYPGMGAKQAELKRMLAAVDAIQSHGVAVNGCFIVGGDGETRATLERLGDFLEQSPFADIQVTLQTPFPGTAIFHQLQREQRLLHAAGNWSAYTLFDVTYRPDPLSPQELQRGFRELVSRVYSAAATSRRQKIRREIDRRARG